MRPRLLADRLRLQASRRIPQSRTRGLKKNKIMHDVRGWALNSSGFEFRNRMIWNSELSAWQGDVGTSNENFCPAIGTTTKAWDRRPENCREDWATLVNECWPHLSGLQNVVTNMARPHAGWIISAGLGPEKDNMLYYRPKYEPLRVRNYTFLISSIIKITLPFPNTSHVFYIHEFEGGHTCTRVRGHCAAVQSSIMSTAQNSRNSQHQNPVKSHPENHVNF